MEQHLENFGGLDDKQYGFRKGRSTVDAISRITAMVETASTGPLYKRELCGLVTLDVANAFNSAVWLKFEIALVRRMVPDYLVRILRSYLSDRELLYEAEGRRKVTCGVPQGSVLGPILWNVMYDDLLALDLGANHPGYSSATLVAFADDVAILATGHNTNLLEEAMNGALKTVSEWMKANGLTLSASKTEAVILTSKRGYEEPSFVLDDTVITPMNEIKYLRVQLSRRQGYKSHLIAATTKASNTCRALSRILPNNGGSGQRRRQLLASVVHSQVLYAAPVWAGSLTIQSNVRILLRPQRTMALRVAKAYRTVSTQAALVVAGLIPVHLLVRERAERHRSGHARNTLKEEEIRQETFRCWQAEWQAAETGSWTRRLIKEVEPWVKRRKEKVDFHLTQALTGHGCFNQYLHKIGRFEHPGCLSCGHETDDAEHTIFGCDRWWRMRRELEVKIEADITPDNMIQLMVAKTTNWKAIAQFIKTIIIRKEQEERERQATAITL